MSEGMALARFQDLADAYGGVIPRWPEEWRDAATRMAAQPAAVAILARAIELDEELDAWTTPPVSASLRERVLSTAPAPRSGIAGRARLWWSGIGIAATLAGAAAGTAATLAGGAAGTAALVAGAAAGTAAVAMIVPADASAGGSTSFGDVGTPES